VKAFLSKCQLIVSRALIPEAIISRGNINTDMPISSVFIIYANTPRTKKRE